MLIQDVWRSQLGWDDEITDNLANKWNIWIEELKKMYNFKIPRQYFTFDRSSSHLQLHIFCDASERCYASVAYLRIQYGNEVQVSFVNAKARVSPLKPMSIPRLELQGALMGARLGNYLMKNLNLNISSTTYWTDSKTVLHWIRSEAGRFKVFVAQRLGEIQELTCVTDWKYVRSSDNVADEATKYVINSSVSADSRWICGPKFLLLNSQEWPREIEHDLKIDSDNLEMKRLEYTCINFSAQDLIPDIPNPERFSKWTRLLRATAYIIRVRNILRAKVFIRNEITVEELYEAEIILYRKVQMESFLEEYKMLQQGQIIKKTSRLFSLSCTFREEDKLMRLDGRLNNSSSLNFDTKHPIILDPKHRITKLIIQHYHENAYHFGQEIVLNKLRCKFWILRMRQAVKNVFHNCQQCSNRRANPMIPIMGQLPSCRIEPTIRPFIKCGVDYFGPFEVAVKRSREKRYGVIFTCLVTRAVYLEIAHDPTTNAFINVLRQFGCRRGFPHEIHSDNGLNFRGAEREISQHLDNLQQNEIIEFCSLRGIKWHFNPPHAPHMGGIWERQIQSIKKILKEILNTRYPQEHILRTFLIECENILNSRPLTHVSSDSHDSEPLTPNHFLIGPDFVAQPWTVTTDNRDLNLMNSWRSAQRLADFFWKRWLDDYLPTIIKRSKWYQEQKNIKVDDIVIIVDPNGTRNDWRKARVVKTYPAKDGRIRIVDVKDGNGKVYRRALSKLIVLDLQ
ncbi:uncharacterized protein LOC116174690 isoform X1 [Photinus pyralis]|uniref:uncharacterized protein LOC116174690 isoform X1 n=1 Tax=Photinus pyralis TaxID=7054 RepID=UPI0012674109|nr:uncharacterized protein LOC116174690 isoform X1 [Photinus pyralis]